MIRALRCRSARACSQHHAERKGVCPGRAWPGVQPSSRYESSISRSSLSLSNTRGSHTVLTSSLRRADHMNRPQFAGPQVWEVPFLAVPERLAHLRKGVATTLRRWGLPGLVDSAQLCTTELITNVITHVGTKTPTWVKLSMLETHVRIEVRDPDPRGVPAPMHAGHEQESGRGLRMVVGMASRWGVIPRAYGKTTWCELATALPTPEPQPTSPRILHTEALLTVYGRLPALTRTSSPAIHQVAQEAATALIADLLHWLQAQGTDPDTALDRAQKRFEAGLARVS
ncbi:ATP-binding protein [Streptomyces abikoensis]|uniref:ATP-binding protein n=1 Tax=Streptomyces abikoensis TaxID=97398 RepID=UPI0036838886